jgi:uncharacterized protein (DUF849 family)
MTIYTKQLRIAAMAAAIGGNIRVGLEDSLWIGPGQLAESNADQVRAARKILDGLGLDIATPEEARDMLGLKGGDKVNFWAVATSGVTLTLLGNLSLRHVDCY